MPHYHDVTNQLRQPFAELRHTIPDVMSSYAALHRAALAEGALSGKVKELIALAIAVTRECDGCIASHARGAARQQATAQEVAEMIGVAVLMNGGPATVWGPRALEAFHEYASSSDHAAAAADGGSSGSSGPPPPVEG